MTNESSILILNTVMDGFRSLLDVLGYIKFIVRAFCLKEIEMKLINVLKFTTQMQNDLISCFP